MIIKKLLKKLTYTFNFKQIQYTIFFEWSFIFSLRKLKSSGFWHKLPCFNFCVEDTIFVWCYLITRVICFVKKSSSMVVWHIRLVNRISLPVNSFLNLAFLVISNKKINCWNILSYSGMGCYYFYFYTSSLLSPSVTIIYLRETVVFLRDIQCCSWQGMWLMSSVLLFWYIFECYTSLLQKKKKTFFKIV